MEWTQSRQWMRVFRTIASDLNNGKVNSEYNIAAQTRIVASYGLLQLTHYTVTDKKLNGFLKTASDKRPEDLNDHRQLMPAYTQLIKMKMKRLDVLGASPPDSLWIGGFEATWRKIFGWYNPKGKPSHSDTTGYGDSVLLNSAKFLPQK